MKREFGSQVDGNERRGRGRGEVESVDVRVFRSHWAYFYGARKRSMMMMMMMPRRQLLPWSGPGSSSCADGTPRRRPSTPVAPSLVLWVSDATMTSVRRAATKLHVLTGRPGEQVGPRASRQRPRNWSSSSIGHCSPVFVRTLRCRLPIDGEHSVLLGAKRAWAIWVARLRQRLTGILPWKPSCASSATCLQL